MALYPPGQPHDKIYIYGLSTQGIFEKAAPLYECGESLRAISRKLNIPKSTIRKTLLEGGVALRSRGKRPLWELSRRRKTALRCAPYGNCLVNGKLVEDPREAAVIQLIMDWWQEGVSHCAIARRLNDQSIKPRRAAQWSQPTVGFIIKRQLKKPGEEEQ